MRLIQHIAWNKIILSLGFLLAATQIVSAQDLISQDYISPGPIHKIKSAQQDAQFQTLKKMPLTEVKEYGAYQILHVNEADFGGREALLNSGLEIVDYQNLIALNGIPLDGTSADLALSQIPEVEKWPDDPAGGLAVDANLYIVQLNGPMKDAEVKQLEALGRKIIYLPMNAFLMELSPAAVQNLIALREQNSWIQFVSPYHPTFRMHTSVRQAYRAGASEAQLITIQLVNGVGSEPIIDEIRANSIEPIRIVNSGPFINVRCKISPGLFLFFATMPKVVQIEPAGQLKRTDERQGVISSGNISGPGPAAPDYLTWLASVGFDSTQFGSFSVNVVDDCFLLTGNAQHPDLPATRVAFEENPTLDILPQGGHGFLNAHIIGGFNNGASINENDSLGYNYGLGIAPWARVGVTDIFGPTLGGLNPPIYENTAYNHGARISTNSWAFPAVKWYDSWAQAFDLIVRDADNSSSGNQEYTIVFAAGNEGSLENSVTSPGTAKNVITVGAGENYRIIGGSGCGPDDSIADNIEDIADFSSRGPVNSVGGDGRFKPDLCSQGTRVQAGIPQSPVPTDYDGTSVCGPYFPGGQTLYSWSTGTSHSTPGVAGGAALVRQWFLNQGMSSPSPAMTKAVLTATAEYMTGKDGKGHLPSNNQGLGRMNYGRAFDGVSKYFDDQTVILDNTGESHQIFLPIIDLSQPVRVALVWTDAPGPTTGAPYVNDLDLQVTVGNETYLGNNFVGAFSVTGGKANFRNNAEYVYLRPGANGRLDITVTASNIAGDGVPGSGDSTDQDFSLFVYNATADCDDNGLIDFQEISNNPNLDCDSNHLIDACEITAQPALDCNNNAILDYCDILNGILEDCDGNLKADMCEILANPILDCNNDSLLNVCEINAGLAEDCNHNIVPDYCETINGLEIDVDSNLVPDVCETNVDVDLNVTSNIQGNDFRIGKEFSFVVSVHNIGSTLSSTVFLSNTIPDNVSLLEMLPEKGICTVEGKIVNCDLGIIIPDEMVSVALAVKGRDLGTATNRATASLNAPNALGDVTVNPVESNVQNNLTVASVDLLAEAPAETGGGGGGGRCGMVGLEGLPLWALAYLLLRRRRRA